MHRYLFGLRLIRALARLLLAAYPADFRRRWGPGFVEAAVHRWRREVAAGPGLGTLRAGLLLCADTLGAAPGAWRGVHGPAPGGSRESRAGGRLAGWLLDGLSDARLALRMMRRQPVTAGLAAATLALGIGISTAAFAALDRVVLTPLPFEDGDRMRYLALRHRTLGWQITPDVEIVDRWRQSARTVERIETYRDVTGIRLDAGPAERLRVTQISLSLPGLLGARPLAGRMLVAADAAADAPRVVMAHETFWRRQLGADAGAVGRVLQLATGPVTIVGVWPTAARFHYRQTPDLIRIVPRDQEFERGSWTAVLALVRPGATDETVQVELDGLASDIGERAATFAAVVVAPSGFLGDDYLQGLWLVFWAAVVLLGVSSVNTANLLLGRATTRRGEMGVRLALGGSPARLLRLFAAESAMLTLAGVVAGLGVAAITAQAYAAWEPLGLVGDRGAWLDGRALAFGAAAAAAAAVLGAVVPAWRMRTASIRDVLAGAGDSRTTDAASRVRAVLVGVQAATAVLLTAGAALTARSYERLASVDPGFDVDPLAMVSVSAPDSRYPTPGARSAFIRRVRDAIEVIPQVERVTVTNAPPFATTHGAGVPVFEGEPAPADAVAVEVATQGVDGEYFAVFGMPLVAGRLFEPSDGRDAIIVNESFARAHGGAVLGRRLRFSARLDDSWHTVVGVVGDVTSNVLTDDPAGRPQLYLPRPSREEESFARFVMRVRGDPADAVREVRARVAEIDRTVPLAEAATVRELFDRQTHRHRFVALLLGGLALVGVVFAVGGVYGVVSLDAVRRRREVGVRMALGATASGVSRHFVGRGVRPVVLGSAAGAAAALLLGPFLEDLLFRVPARDPWSVTAGVLLVVATAALASMLPARRAARVDPALTLRH